MSEANSDFSERSLAHYQYKGHYIMTAVKSGLMIVDQQRADMRIRFERYMKQMETHISPSQQVLFPEVVQFPASLAVLLNKVLLEINNMGFDLTDLGQNSYSINGVPAGLEGIDCKALLVSMLDDAADNVSSSTPTLSRPHHGTCGGYTRRTGVVKRRDGVAHQRTLHLFQRQLYPRRQGDNMYSSTTRD